MNELISRQIQEEQNHGRQKYGSGPDDLSHDDRQDDAMWYSCIFDHNERAKIGTPMERRQHLIKIAGLAVSAVESFDRHSGDVPSVGYDLRLVKEPDGSLNWEEAGTGASKARTSEQASKAAKARWAKRASPLTAHKRKKR